MRGSRADSSIDGSEAPSAKIFMFLRVAKIDMLSTKETGSLANRAPERKSETRTSSRRRLPAARGSGGPRSGSGLQRHHQVHSATVGGVAADDLLLEDSQPRPLRKRQELGPLADELAAVEEGEKIADEVAGQVDDVGGGDAPDGLDAAAHAQQGQAVVV